MERNSPAKFIKYLERLHKYSSVVEVIDDGQVHGRIIKPSPSSTLAS